MSIVIRSQHGLLSNLLKSANGVNVNGFGFLFPGLNQPAHTPSFKIPIPGFIGEWILKAVPKKKPSYRKTRQKLYAPGDKKIQPLENLVRCPACGSVKRSHFMCMNCFSEIKSFLKTFKPKAKTVEQNLDEIDEQILYPGKRLTDHQRRLQKKDYIPKREKSLLYDSAQVKHPRSK